MHPAIRCATNELSVQHRIGQSSISIAMNLCTPKKTTKTIEEVVIGVVKFDALEKNSRLGDRGG